MDIPDTAGKRPLKRGFACMTPERRLEIARKGGASVPGEKRAFATNAELAREAGRKGGSVAIKRRRGDA
ncbi:general stress protein [Brevundimonas sp.]|uniref:general stress protein n=1 Tax=Brevundimonas sp. TaxID=1871086 RepID=UPI00286D42CE|nr:general stress protein [Brevundimonas sp.]